MRDLLGRGESSLEETGVKADIWPFRYDSDPIPQHRLTAPRKGEDAIYQTLCDSPDTTVNYFIILVLRSVCP